MFAEHASETETPRRYICRDLPRGGRCPISSSDAPLVRGCKLHVVGTRRSLTRAPRRTQGAARVSQLEEREERDPSSTSAYLAKVACDEDHEEIILRLREYRSCFIGAAWSIRDGDYYAWRSRRIVVKGERKSLPFIDLSLFIFFLSIFSSRTLIVVTRELTGRGRISWDRGAFYGRPNSCLFREEDQRPPASL